MIQSKQSLSLLYPSVEKQLTSGSQITSLLSSMKIIIRRIRKIKITSTKIPISQEVILLQLVSMRHSN